jgi:hypothetical protein
MINKYYVYSLLDPRKNNQPFYIGKGSGKRAQTHLFETEENTDNIRKFLKIKKIRASGLEPVIEYIASNLEEDKAYDLEAKLIRQYGRAKIDVGGILTNICIDNRPPNMKGVPGQSPNEQTRQKISISLKNKTTNERQEIQRKLTETLSQRTEQEKEEIQRKLTETLSQRTEQEKEETRQKIRIALTGRVNGPPSDETRQKIGDAQRGEKNHRYGEHWSEEEKQQRSEWAVANGIKPPVRSGPMSEEQKEAIRKGNTGKKRTPEQSAYLSSIRKGKKRSPRPPEVIEKIRLSNIATKARQRLQALTPSLEQSIQTDA